MDRLLSGAGLAFGLWLFYRAWQRSESPLKILFKGLLTVVLLAGGIVLIHKINSSLIAGPISANAAPALLAVAAVAVGGMALSLIWSPHIGNVLISPLTNLFDGGSEPPDLQPAYSTALAKRAQKQPLEAVVAIREQLARFPNDFKGVMLLANIQAEEMNDLPGAELTLRRFCDAPGVPNQQVLTALTRLADLHLNQTADEDSALAIMEELLARFPEAEISRRAAQRLGRSNRGKIGPKPLSAAKTASSVQEAGIKPAPKLRIHRR